MLLIDGNFSKAEALDIVTRMVDVKIRFHESKIQQSADEEDVKSRERKIKTLQHELQEFRESLLRKDNVDIHAEVISG